MCICNIAFFVACNYRLFMVYRKPDLGQSFFIWPKIFLKQPNRISNEAQKCFKENLSKYLLWWNQNKIWRNHFLLKNFFFQTRKNVKKSYLLTNECTFIKQSKSSIKFYLKVVNFFVLSQLKKKWTQLLSQSNILIELMS